MSAAQFITGQVTATLVAGTAAVTLTAPGSGAFVLPVGIPIPLYLGGVRLTASSAGGNGTVSSAFACERTMTMDFPLAVSAPSAEVA